MDLNVCTLVGLRYHTFVLILHIHISHFHGHDMDMTLILIKLNLPFLLEEFPWRQWGCRQGWNGSEGHKGIGCIEILDWWSQWQIWYWLWCPQLNNQRSCPTWKLGWEFPWYRASWEKRRCRWCWLWCLCYRHSKSEWWMMSLHIKQLVLPKFGIKRKFAPHQRTCHTADFSQMCQENDAPHWRTCHTADIGQMWQKNMPLIGGLYQTADFDQMWSNNVALVTWLCLAVDFDQMWSKMCPSSEDFVSLQTSTKCGLKCAPCWRTLSHCGLWPNVAQTCAPWQRTLFCFGVQPNMDQQRTHCWKGWYKTNSPWASINMELNCHLWLHCHMISTLKGICTNEPQQKMMHFISITWQMTNDTDCTQPSPIQHCITMREGSFLIGFTWTSWRFLHAFAGLLVNATMIALFACWRLEQNGNEGAIPQQQIMHQKAKYVCL